MSDRTLVGAHYYLWYPTNFNAGYLRKFLEPPQQPALGLYSSADPKVIEQHIAWASEFGIDFFTLDWWPKRKEEKLPIIDAFLKAPNISDIRFCIFYETLGLGFNQNYGVIGVREELRKKLVEDVKFIAERFFDHPSYLRVNGRPVIVFYVTRTMIGEYVEAFAELRQELASWNPFIIGDEVFWFNSQKPEGAEHPSLTTEPRADRMALFDALTAYNLYESTYPSHRGYGESSLFFQDASRIYAEFREISGLPIIPYAMPGYNDRGVRLHENHYVIPRRLGPSQGEGTFFAEMLERVTIPNIDARVPMIFVTSWNEWNEDSAIEPLAASPTTARDKSESGTQYTEGYQFEAHGNRYLEILRDKMIAVAGKLSDEAGAPAPGLELSLWQSGREVARTRSDSRGHYTFSRRFVADGPAQVRFGHETREVEVLRKQCVSQVDFVTPKQAK